MRLSTSQTDAPRIRWSCQPDGRGVSLVRQLSLHFEVRRDRHRSPVVLRIHTDREILAWELPSLSLSVAGRLASELTAPSLEDYSAPTIWDEGRGDCEVSIPTLHQFRSAYAAGGFRIFLRGQRIRRELEFERTGLVLDTRTQWLVRTYRPIRPQTSEIA